MHHESIDLSYGYFQSTNKGLKRIRSLDGRGVGGVEGANGGRGAHRGGLGHGSGFRVGRGVDSGVKGGTITVDRTRSLNQHQEWEESEGYLGND